MRTICGWLTGSRHDAKSCIQYGFDIKSYMLQHVLGTVANADTVRPSCPNNTETPGDVGIQKLYIDDPSATSAQAATELKVYATESALQHEVQTTENTTCLDGSCIRNDQ